MKQKLTASELALWAALPMAHTPEIEGRLRRILDGVHTRRFNRRIFYPAAALGLVALGPLAMLHLDAKAQTVSAIPRLIQLMGITDATMPNGNEWGADGQALPRPIFRNYWGQGTKVTTKPGQKARFFVFHLSKSLQHAPVIYDVSGTTYDGFTMTRMGRSPHQKVALSSTTLQSIQMQTLDHSVVYGAAFPASLSQTNIRVGRASGPWAPALFIRSPFAGKYTFGGGSSLSPSTEMYLSDSKIMFSSPISLNRFQEFRVVTADKKGHQLLLHPTVETSRGDRERVTVHLPQHPSLIRELRIETKPFAWTEFKDVALQPAQAASPISQASVPLRNVIPSQNYSTLWTSQVTRSKWQPRTTFHMAIHIAPGVSGTRPEPPVTGKLIYGPGNVSHFSIQTWKPGKSNLLTVKFDYTPKVTDKVHPDIIHLLTKQGTVASILTYYSI